MGSALWARRAGTALVLGTLISTLLTVLLYAFTDTPDADAFIIGLVGTALAILIEVVIRLEHISDDTSLLRRAGNFSDQVRELVEGTGRIVASYHDRGPERSLKERYEELIEDLGNLEDGRITSHGSDYRHLLETMATARVRVDAVTNVIGSGGGDAGWWGSEVGQKYWAANKDALRRGLEVHRIFIVASMTASDDKLLALMQEQKASGVNIRWLERSTVDPGLHLNLAVWDDQVAWEARTNAQGIQYETTLMFAPRDVAKLKRAYDVLYSVSQSF
jgi:phage gp46-like protein